MQTSCRCMGGWGTQLSIPGQHLRVMAQGTLGPPLGLGCSPSPASCRVEATHMVQHFYSLLMVQELSVCGGQWAASSQPLCCKAQPAPCTKGDRPKVWAVCLPAIPHCTPPTRGVRGSRCPPHSVGPGHWGRQSF